MTHQRKMPLSDFPLWTKTHRSGALLEITLELTNRCNNNCRHCYVNTPVADTERKFKELPLEQLRPIIDQAVNLGALWCLITGGEPLLRSDFPEIYSYLKKKGLLVTVFTNAEKVEPAHVRMFRRYPPRSLEVTVYGVTAATYERVTRQPGSFQRFQKGLDRLLAAGLPVHLKTMALRSNLHELAQIRRFCREKSRSRYRFDPFLHLRYDRDSGRNREIIEERLSPEEIVRLETEDPDRWTGLQKACNDLIQPGNPIPASGELFGCSAGRHGIVISADGWARPCQTLWHPDFLYDAKQLSLVRIRREMNMRLRNTRSTDRRFLTECGRCPILNLCMWCPAVGFLETGSLDKGTDYFCRLAHARANILALEAIKKGLLSKDYF
jgi:radical SAM protein with 4Fe4S-binding SPASM domain